LEVHEARDRISQVETQYVILAVYQISECITLIVNFFTRDMNITLWMCKQIIMNYCSLITTQHSWSSGKHLFRTIVIFLKGDEHMAPHLYSFVLLSCQLHSRWEQNDYCNKTVYPFSSVPRRYNQSYFCVKSA